MSEIAIKLENISKFYKLYNSPGDRLKEALNPFGRCYHNKFYATKNVSLEVKKGEILGIVGKNGSGKSTLLKLITGVLSPNEGSIAVDGKVSALLELGSGFNPMFTGMQNIFFYGAILGFSQADMEEKLDSILEFADLGGFISQPLKTYSSGMKSRLGFAVAVSVDPEILILDEVLAVGDEFFRRKCYLKMQEFFNAGKTILFVSHSLQTINEFCTRCILVDAGKVVLQGQTDIVVKMYRKMLFSSSKDIEVVRNEIKGMVNTYGIIKDPVRKTGGDTRPDNSSDELHSHYDDRFITKTAQAFGPCDIDYNDILIFDRDGKQVNNLVCGEDYNIRFKVRLNQDVHGVKLNFGVGIGAENNVFISGAHSNDVCSPEGVFKKGSEFHCSLSFSCQLLMGNYFLTCTTLLVCETKRVMLRKLVDGYMFKVEGGDKDTTGMVRLLSQHNAQLM